MLYTSISIISVSCILLFVVLLGFRFAGIEHVLYPEGNWAYRLAFLSYFVIQLFSSVILTLFNTNGKFGLGIIISLANALLPLVFVGIVYSIGQDFTIEKKIYFVIMSYLLSFIIAALIGFGVLFKNIHIERRLQTIDREAFKSFAKYSALAYLSNIATFLCYKFDIWVVNEHYSKFDVGIYSLSTQLVQMLWILPQTIGAVLLTYASKATPEDALQMTVRVTKVGLYITTLFSLIALALSKPMIPIIYGSDFSGVTILILIQILGIIPFTIPTIIASFYASKGNFTISFWISILVTVLAMLLYLILIPNYGVKGGAFASAITYLLGGVISLIYFCARYNVNALEILRLSKEDILALTKLIKK